jgi:hypothetical protein
MMEKPATVLKIKKAEEFVKNFSLFIFVFFMEQKRLELKYRL